MASPEYTTPSHYETCVLYKCGKSVLTSGTVTVRTRGVQCQDKKKGQLVLLPLSALLCLCFCNINIFVNGFSGYVCKFCKLSDIDLSFFVLRIVL